MSVVPYGNICHRNCSHPISQNLAPRQDLAAWEAEKYKPYFGNRVPSSKLEGLSSSAMIVRGNGTHIDLFF